MAIRYKTLTQKEYDALATYETDLIYYVADTGKQYLNGTEYNEDADLSKQVVKDFELKGDFGKNSELQIDGKAVVTVSANGKIDPSLVPEVGGTEWGAITGTLADQTDLQTALNGKANTSDIPAAQVQADWDESDSSAMDYIKNKPVLTEDPLDYLAFYNTKNTATTLSILKTGSPDAISLEYSFDKVNWTEYTTFGTDIAIAGNAKIWWRGNNLKISNYAPLQQKYYKFNSTGYLEVSGNLTSLLSKTLTMTSNWIPAGCFAYLFSDVANMTGCPVLPNVSTVLKYGYCNCFYGTKITKAPYLGATSLETGAYKHMFAGCAYLTDVQDTFAFAKAYSLSQQGNVFESMFSGCNRLVHAPVLPNDSHFRSSCFKNTFANCTSLQDITIPFELSAYDNNCEGMLSNCTSLQKIRFYPSTWGMTDCFKNWLSSASSTGTFECLSTLQIGSRDASRVPSGWVIVRYDAQYSDWSQTDHTEANYVKNRNICAETAVSEATYTLDAGQPTTPVVTVASALTLNAGTVTAGKIAYAEIVLDVATGATVTAGTGITIVDTLTAGKRNVCVVRWADGVAKLYVTLTEDLDESSSSN